MHVRLCFVGVVIGTVACAGIRPGPLSGGPQGDRIVITQAMIERSKGKTAWEVLKIEAPDFTYSEKRAGDPVKIERRGQSTFLLNDAPMIYLDGIRLTDLRNLQQIEAATLRRIEILNALDGTTYYGTDAEGGVILMFSKNGTSSS
ncbi:MAG TPA: TonB-dependent receptor plug domain-containing protein [Gemmatimonadales bacterium]|nr:TonB-dependent receptor plug domain-containing protein [Gemmatimonadales bacterium]